MDNDVTLQEYFPINRKPANSRCGYLGTVIITSVVIFKSRHIDRTDKESVREATMYNAIESAIALFVSFVINLFVVAVFAAAFNGPQYSDAGFSQAGTWLYEKYGLSMKIIWGIGLLAAGQSSTITGFLNIKWAKWKRVLLTRSIAIVPAIVVALAATDGLDNMNNWLNVLQSVQLPFALLPILHFTNTSRIMGEFKNGSSSRNNRRDSILETGKPCRKETRLYFLTMAAKVVPIESDKPRDMLHPQQLGKNDLKVSTASIQHHDEAVEVQLDYGSGNGNSEITWIKNHIKMRKCSYYMPSLENNICQCGYDKEDKNGHDQNAFSRPKREGESIATRLKWDFQKHTVAVPTDAFGEIEFVGFGGNIGKFVRVDRQTDMPTMLKLMMNVWGMEKPNLLISVTGGAKNFNMKPRLRDVFRRGLMKAAHSTGAWIITGGTHAGVMKHVGEAVKDYGLTTTNQKPVVAIGIAPWGVIQNRDALTNEKGAWPAGYRIEENLNSKESFLDPNHSHFILVDNGTQHKFATEIPFRAELEREISEMQTDTGDDAVSVPIVILVLEGGPGTLETVQNALMQNTPAVIVKGSGRAADILSYAFKYAETVEVDAKDKQGIAIKITEKHLSPSLEAEIHKQMKDIKFCPDQDIDVNMQRIKDCLAKSELIHIFEWDSGTGARDIDVAMLKALLKANKNHVMDQLKLALAWNRIDIAKSEIFTDDKRWTTGILDDIMLSAIQLNRVNFVELFLDNGVSLKEFLTIKRLLLLYNNVSSRSLLKILFKKMWQKKNEVSDKKITLKDVGLLIQDLLGDYYVPHYISDERYASIDAELYLNGVRSCKDKKWVKKGLALAAQAFTESILPSDSKQVARKKVPDFDDPAQELFIWSVLTTRQEMAKLFWLHGKDAIAGALVANALLHAMSDRTDDTELLVQIKANTSEFMNLSIGVLKECYSTDEIKAQCLLIRELPQWGATTCILIAVKADNKRFISQTACQDLFNSIWMGDMTQENGTVRLLICIAIPPLIPLLAKYKEKEEGELALAQTTRSSVEFQMKSKPPLLRGRTNVSLKASHPSLPEQETKDDSGNETKVNVKNFSIWEKFSSFYQAPVVIFFHNVISYMVFLGLYSYILISKLGPNLSPEEIVLIVWVFTNFTEEIRQISTTASMTLKTKLLSYITDGWNILDVITISLFVIGMILRSIDNSETLEAARIILAVNLIAFFVRLLHIFSVHKELGPKLVMIFRMVRNLTSFVVILLVFIVSYAIASYAILYPNSELNLDTLVAIFRRPYWNIYGELMLDEVEGYPNCTTNETLFDDDNYHRCPTKSGKYFVPVLMGVYVLMCNILLLNLLIAMFSYTFQMVQENTDMHWYFQRYSLIHEYYSRPFLAPPLILIVHIYQLIRAIVRKCRHCTKRYSPPPRRNAFLKHFANARELRQWEDVIADSFHHKRDITEQESTDNRLRTTGSRLDQLVNKIDELQEQQLAGNVTVEDSKSNPSQTGSLSEQKSNPGAEPVLTNLEKKMENMEKQLHSTLGVLQWIVKSLNEHQLGSKWAVPEVTDVRVEEKKQEEKKAAEARALVYHMLEGQVKVHTRSRTSPYPGTNIHRFEVPNDKVPWDVEFLGYDPPSYISPELSDNPNWADRVDLYQIPVVQRSIVLKFNSVDLVTKTSRVSYAGNYHLQNGIPMNPIGRTGLMNRGSLGRWGPNHAVDPVITRWKYHETGQKMMEDGKPVFEFVSVRRLDSGLWALPGSILAPGRLPTENLKIKFSEEALGALGEDRRQKKKIKKEMEKLLRKGELIYQGYADDPRNTDNAWLESTVYLYQDEKDILRHFSLTAGAAGHPATWLTASSKLSLYGAHSYFLKLTAEKLGASF
ncbi:hypothetical protein CHS0354_019660 [Potamilus streckersoni]|uniref:Transient receptor potential cation channel subfamily M member 2 n=1 Tax=Potamilus streckersoni TaxID=2493646 RepID=A0AAE0T979_9BIVA|nr:hypothetical protein CHS0354_019660 [Potamilus streckersoni]